LLLITLSSCTTLKPPAIPVPFTGNFKPITDYLPAFIKQEIKKGKLTGLSIALVTGDRMIWSEGFGNADKKLKIKSKANTRYRAG